MTSKLQNYRDTTMNNVHGWVGEKIIHALDLIISLHDRYHITGDALEIGVYHGRFFLALMAAIESSEVAVAADIFDDVHLNIDKSGFEANLHSIFSNNVKNFGERPESLRIVQGDSMVLRATDLLDLSPNKGYRLISVDGGHTPEHVLNDLSLAASIITNGGVIFLDDISSPHWPGVHEGYVKYMANLNRNLAPVICVDNKLILTTISMQETFVSYFKSNFSTWPDQELRTVKSFGFEYIASA